MKCCNCSVEIFENSTFCFRCGVRQNVVNTDEQIDFIEEKLSVTNYSFSTKGRLDCQKWIQEFGFEEVSQAVDIALQQYLQFDKEGNPIEQSTDVVFKKISGICANRKIAREKPYMADTLRMVGYANKKFRLSQSLEKDYKEHIERILYLLFREKDKYSELYEDFFWKMKSTEDKWEFLEEMKNIVYTLEQSDKK